MRAFLIIASAIIVGAVIFFVFLGQLDDTLHDRIDNRDDAQMFPFRSRPECVADCGVNGWQKMKESCGQTVDSASDLKTCLMRFRWSSVNAGTDTAEFSDGFIDIGGTHVWNSFSVKSIRVHIYRQWAADADGNLYLLQQSG